MTNIDSIISYWRDSCSDADKMGIDYSVMKSAKTVPSSEIAQGRVPPKVAAALFKDQVNAQRRSRQPEQHQVSQTINIVICPILGHKSTERSVVAANLDKTIMPLWVPAILHESGALEPQPDIRPWISRNLLEPTDRMTTIIVGTVNDTDRFFASQQQPDSEEGWDSYWAYCCRMFHAVTGFDVGTFDVPQYNIVHNTTYLLAVDTVQGSRQHIIKLYNQIIEEHCFTNLLSRYASGAPAELRPILDTSKQQLLAKQHVGQMRALFPLSISQREALHHFLNMAEGEILAVNGPPGTGKTTLIQSIVATLWVNAALLESKPPIIVAASANNQAVRNVIQSFSQASDQAESLSMRWLPDVTSYGLYCVSPSKAQQSLDFQVEFPDSAKTVPGFNAHLESPEFVREAITFFLNCFEQHFQSRPSSVEQAAQSLKQHLINTVQQLQRGLQMQDEIQSLREELLLTYHEHGGIDSYLYIQQECLSDMEQQNLQHQKLVTSWRVLTRSDSLIMSLFDFLPPIRRRLAVRYGDFFIQQGMPNDTPHGSYREVEAFLKQQGQDLQIKLTSLQTIIQRTQAHKQRLDVLLQAWQHWCAEHSFPDNEGDPAEIFDTTLRFAAFELATHYWEARWLIEVQQIFAGGQLDTNIQQQSKWQRYAMITPCFVSTLHMAPRFFTVWEHKQLVEAIDLLIIDEAGQISPEVAGATFALAKKALVVGDILQIQPVESVTKHVDIGNLQRSGVARSQEQQRNAQAAGLTAVGGSVMVIAQRATHYQKSPRQRGMVLREHRRCVPEIIAYCNELAYRGELVPLRPSEKCRLFPPIGYAHVSGTSKRYQGSRENIIEAVTIVRWIETQLPELEKFYHKPIEEIIGIITPFKRQVEHIEAHLRQSKFALAKITVGTVHALQGAERPIVIFSSVYSEQEQFFFDRSVNMLNVAVSRAKDSFLVFGNMAIFETGTENRNRQPLPSSLLARYLFADSVNELTSIPLQERQTPGVKPFIHRINTLTQHRSILADSLKQARQHVVIVSPYIRERVIKNDGLDQLIRDAVQRGVDVSIYTNDQLDYNQQKKQLNPGVAEGRALLKASGAQLHIISRIHNKTLCVDNRLLIEGSFNWLSAIRDEQNQYQNHEVSFQYEGPGVDTFILQAIQELQAKQAAKIVA